MRRRMFVTPKSATSVCSAIQATERLLGTGAQWTAPKNHRLLHQSNAVVPIGSVFGTATAESPFYLA